MKYKSERMNEVAPKKKAAKVKKETAVNSSSKKSEKPRELKKLDKGERLQYALQSFLWWNGGTQLSHLKAASGSPWNMLVSPFLISSSHMESRCSMTDSQLT